MFCNKCGTEISNESLVCPNCGNKCETSSETKTIKLQCSNCGGIMEVDADKQEVTCSYCGAKEKIIDSDAVAIEKIKSSTYKEMEFARMENENQKEMSKEAKEEQIAYRKGNLSKFTLAFVFLCLLFMISAFKSHHILAGIIALIQTCLFAVSWLMGMQIVKEKKKFFHMALAILGFLLIIPFTMSNRGKIFEKIDWPNEGLALYLPEPESKYGKISINSSERFNASIEKMDSSDYADYLKACKDKGFTVESDSDTNLYNAYNEEGYKLSLYFYNDALDISLDAPKEMGEFKWPDSEIAKLLPKPKSTSGKIESEREDGFQIYVGKTSVEEFDEYTEQVKKAGFDVDYSKEDTYYCANNKDGYQVSIQYEGNGIMVISIDAPDEDSKETAKKSETMEKSDDASSDKEKTEKKETAKKKNDKKKKKSAKVDADLKAFLDSYEDFIDEYIVFMQKYSESDNAVSMLADYTEMMSKYTDFQSKIDKYDEDTMSEADLAYYTEVITRCSKKLSDASL